MKHINKTVCFTGHRPDKLGGYDAKDNAELIRKLKDVIVDYIENKGVTTFISGMALGIDMWSARIIIALKESQYPQIKLISAIPCKNQYAIWKDQKAIDEWHYVVDKADIVHYVSEEPYTAWCLHDRNKWMVDNSKYVIAVWDGSKGGTYNCINYAKKQDKDIYNINPKTLETKRIA